MINQELQLAQTIIEQTDRHLFLTGKAGTGKTTFLHQLKQHCAKRMIITAPTGVAAINAGGVTLHSFFQLPFGPYLPGTQLPQSFRFSQEKRNIIRGLDLLVIDEISMVRADLLDAVDAVLRQFKHRDRPFGGVQLLMIGDLHQLPPVIRDAEWSLLNRHYDTGYFFSSLALRQTEMTSIELQHIYRQSDPHFVELLNRVRDNQVDADILQQLNVHCRPGFQPDDQEEYVTLTTHNQSADRLNKHCLAALNSRTVRYRARVEGDFPEPYPTAEQLELKLGTQVMFIRNDRSPEKRFYNGKVGKITFIDENVIRVRCPGDSTDITVEHETWQNIRYGLDSDTKGIIDEVIGSFTQIPLRPAWAITIHKSQGLTFERVILDGEAAFAHGQIYVALSRCKSLDGLVLSTPLSAGSVMTDEQITQFSQQNKKQALDESQLYQAKAQYQQRLLMDCFDYQPLHKQLRRLSWLLRNNAQRLKINGFEQLGELEAQFEHQVLTVAGKFQRQLQGLFQSGQLPVDDEQVQARLNKASGYFSGLLETGLINWLASFSFESDNQQTTRQINKATAELQRLLTVKSAALNSIGQCFSLNTYLNAVALAEIQDKKSRSGKQKTTVALPDEENLAHPQLVQRLKAWRTQQAADEALPAYVVLPQKPLYLIAEYLPANTQVLLQIQGIGPGKQQKYGDTIVQIVQEYCAEKGITAQDSLPEITTAETGKSQNKPAASSEKQPTRLITLELFRSGKSPTEIAQQRDMTVGTIESHLAVCIKTHELKLQDLLSQERITVIQKAIAEVGIKPLRPIKDLLGNDYSYGEIHWVIAAMDVDE